MLLTGPTNIRDHLIFLLLLSMSLLQQHTQAAKSAIFVNQQYQGLNNKRRFAVKQKIVDASIRALPANKNSKQPRSLSQATAQGAGIWSNAFN
ncbi:MAG: hypothetical protein OXD32_03340, partial [Endozoicomonadaceae bacterium]|nr:hypothetical protein [Endozoicomonadaceae bacterium]